MIIETQFNVGDRVYVLDKNIEEYKVEAITIKVGSNNNTEIFYDAGKYYFPEQVLSATRDEAAEKWLRKQGIER
jgi:exosome complex RNA-binding protein Rrp42 (RNase PH superfamily)